MADEIAQQLQPRRDLRLDHFVTAITNRMRLSAVPTGNGGPCWPASSQGESLMKSTSIIRTSIVLVAATLTVVIASEPALALCNPGTRNCIRSEERRVGKECRSR